MKKKLPLKFSNTFPTTFSSLTTSCTKRKKQESCQSEVGNNIYDFMASLALFPTSNSAKALLYNKKLMASRRIKQEPQEDHFDDKDPQGRSSSVSSCETSVTSPPTRNGSALSNPEDAGHPKAKRPRVEVSEDKPLQNGRDESATMCLFPAYEHFEGSHSSDLLSRLNEKRMSEQFVDMLLVVGGNEIPCHKVVLCSVSEHFAEILAPNSATRYQQRIYVNETSSDIMLQLVEFAYTSRIKITDQNIDKLLAAAKLFKFPAVRRACLIVLKHKLSTDNCMLIRRFASKQGCDDLVECVDAFIRDNFADVSTCEEFVDWTLNEILSFISCKTLNVTREETVYNTVMRWVLHDVITRRDHLPELLESVRLPLVKPQFLLDVVETNPLIKNNKKCEKYLDEAKRFHLLPDQRPFLQSCRTQPRLTYSLKKMEILVTIGGLNKEKTPLSDCAYFNFPEPYMRQLAPLKAKQTAYSVAVVNNNVFVTGGACQIPCKEVWMYIPSLDKWQQVAPMNEARYLHASVGLHGYLYVLGGHNGSERLKSVEKYCPDTNTWQHSKPLLKPLSSPTAVASEGMLYLIGGARGSSTSDVVADVQCYNPTAEQWSLVAPLPQPERGAIAAELNGIIYVMGQRKSVFAYNRKSNKWMKKRCTNGGHMYGAATVHRGVLYAAGGLHGNSYINGTVETYDPSNDSWQVTATLHVPVYAQGFISIFKDDDATVSKE